MGTPKTVLHGIDQSVADYYELPDKGHHATLCLQEDDQFFWLYDPSTQKWHPFEYVVFSYDYATDGGSIGFHNLDVELPENTIIWDGVIDVTDHFTSGGAATIAIKAAAADDILAAAVLGTNGTIGLHDVVPDGTAANAIRLDADTQIKMDIRVAALTSGTLYGFLRCFRGFSLLESSSSSSASTSSSASSSSSSTLSSSSTSNSSSSSSSTSSTLVSTSSSSSSSMVSTSASSASSSSSSSSSTAESSSSSSQSESSSSSSSSPSSSSSSSSSTSAQTG